MGDAAPAIYVLSNLLVFAMVLRNVRIPGMALAAVGAASNLVAIIANERLHAGRPARAFASLGLGGPGYTNSTIVTNPVLPFLTDIFAMPAWMPAANVFSIGDVLLGAGVALTIALAMRAPAHAVTASAPELEPDAIA